MKGLPILSEEGLPLLGFLWVAIRVSEFWVLGSRFRGFIRLLLLLLFPYPVRVSSRGFTFGLHGHGCNWCGAFHNVSCLV